MRFFKVNFLVHKYLQGHDAITCFISFRAGTFFHESVGSSLQDSRLAEGTTI